MFIKHMVQKMFAFNTNKACLKKEKREFLIIFSFVLLWLALPLTSALAQSSKHFLWSVSDSSGLKLYLLGSIHMAQEKLYPLDPVIEDAFNQSSRLIIEFDPSNVGKLDLAEKFFRQGLYVGDETIWDHLDPETADLLRSCLSKTSFDEMVVSKMRPWLLAMTLSVEKLLKLGYNDNIGLDIHFIQEAKAKSLGIHELETVEEQLEAMIAFNEIDSFKFLKTTILELDQIEEQIERIFTAWKNGDDKDFAEIYFDVYRTNPELEPVLVKLIDERNSRMFERIKPFIILGQTAFVVVGSAHLVGPNGLLEAFKAAGYEVRQL
jgi:uncharacterized protein YbaP (TraB family)